MKKVLLFLLALTFTVSCTTIDSGHTGVAVSWGGETDMKKVYTEGVDYGFNWLFDEMVEYNTREQTSTGRYEFNDRNNMSTKVEIAVDYKLDPVNVNKLHKFVADWKTKLNKTIKSAAKEVIPQYSSVELNIHKRGEAEDKLRRILEKELPDFYLQFVRVQITDVDLPPSVAGLAEETAKQVERNNLASKKEAEKVALAKAVVAEAKGEFEAAEYKAKAREILSTPKMIELQRVENEKIMWEGYRKHGRSPFGEHNIYGNVPTIFKNMQ